MESKHLRPLDESKRMDTNRQKLAEYIYGEASKGDFSSSMSLYKAVTQELNNISDEGIKIMLQQKEL